MTDKTVAFIPVRGGSKSIPYKNIKNICGKPLVIWSIEAAVNSEKIDEVIISTDSNLIEETILYYFKTIKIKSIDKIKIFRRSEANATDEATTESAMLEYAIISQFKKIVLIQATSPLITTADINRGIEKYNTNQFDSILSLVRQKRFIWNFDEETEQAAPANYKIEKRPRRQEFSGYLVENGALYITSRNLLINTGQRISGKIGFIEMPEESYFELDEPADWIIVEELLKQRQQQDNTDIAVNAKKIKLFAMDCDGVLTDAGMYYSPEGDLLKKFNTKDGMGIARLHDAGIKTAIITGEDTSIVKRRAEKLKINELHLGIKDKVAVMESICNKYGYSFEEIAYIGDDINDLQLLEKVGISFTVADGHNSLKEIVGYQTQNKGGQGAVREAIDFILEHRLSTKID
ncbi:acylneuraminate cytidylyltransferase [Desulfuribacillus alkaliarsenatis]|uniref:N-acylneuraminate cytidylyltransferase n=1 Tax=Desulfuribacillus alkaliarsenatis TaxID=766136 RepID=A0A1E5G3S2_9FIRM|nr:acylneuraminate cytidylyltransferase [Desulfuribacillus alkaliarsenatis]OEF97716.1 acylneuraminate cytidylyltransferase [Desulfuribacillus alkaliarsenatis]